MQLVRGLEQKLKDEEAFRTSRDRRGTILVLTAIAMVLLMAFVAFALDIGYISLTRAQLQNATDGAALAAANELSGVASLDVVEANAKAAAVSVASANKAGDQNAVFIKPSNVEFGKRTYNQSTGRYSYQWGRSSAPYNIVKVSAKRQQFDPANPPPGGVTSEDLGLPLFFAPFIGNETADLHVSSLASFQPRDIVVVLDFSASMNDDSELDSISELGRTTVETNLGQIWSDLGNPTYGTLPLIPKYVTTVGQNASGNIPKITVEWRGTSVYVTSTKTLTNVRLEFESNGGNQTFSSLSGTTGTFQGTGSKAGKYINKIYVKSGSNSSSDCTNCGEKFEYTVAKIKTGLGLPSSYPYASGDWDDYVDYCLTDSGVKSAGYERKFGGYTLIDYWLSQKPRATQTADLWKVRAQPVATLKSGLSFLVGVLKAQAGEDKMGLVIYDSADGTAIKESSMTSNLDSIDTIVSHRQAGHYEEYTNISAGMQKGREELLANSRPKSYRFMVLMTDGVANKPTSTTVAKQKVLTEAQTCATNRIKILTISLGAGADTALMQQVADITGGQHFNVPGGEGIDRYKTQLEQAFQNIASDRPLRLISDPNAQ